MKVNLENVIERYYNTKGDLNDNSICDFLNCEDDDRTEPCNRVGEKLKEIHDSSKHGDNVKKWANNGPFGPEVFEAFGFDYDIFEEQINKYVERDAEMIKEKTGFNEAETAKDLLNLSQGVISNFRNNYESLKEEVPKDDPVWVADILMEHGYEEVDLYTWHAAQYLFKKNVENKAMGLMEGGITGLMNRFQQMF